MDTRDELKAEAYREQQEERAVWAGEPLPPVDPPEPVTRADVLHAVSVYSALSAAAHGMPDGCAAWGRAHRAYCTLQDVIHAFGLECATTGEVL